MVILIGGISFSLKVKLDGYDLRDGSFSEQLIRFILVIFFLPVIIPYLIVFTIIYEIKEHFGMNKKKKKFNKKNDNDDN